MEMWKRRAVSLATEWDVETFDEDEPDRPDFCGTEIPVFIKLFNYGS